MFKINDYLSTIDNRLGSPINSFYFTAKYSMRGYEDLDGSNWGFCRRLKYRLRYYWVLAYLRFGGLVMSLLVRNSETLSKEADARLDDLNRRVSVGNDGVVIMDGDKIVFEKTE